MLLGDGLIRDCEAKAPAPAPGAPPACLPTTSHQALSSGAHRGIFAYLIARHRSDQIRTLVGGIPQSGLTLRLMVCLMISHFRPRLLSSPNGLPTAIAPKIPTLKGVGNCQGASRCQCQELHHRQNQGASIRCQRILRPTHLAPHRTSIFLRPQKRRSLFSTIVGTCDETRPVGAEISTPPFPGPARGGLAGACGP